MAQLAVMSSSEVEAVANSLSTTIEQSLTKTDQEALSAKNFCSIWKTIEPILRQLQPIAPLIPVVGVIIAGAIATLLTLGKAAALALHCPQ